jgi:hypothetical protein
LFEKKKFKKKYHRNVPNFFLGFGFGWVTQYPTHTHTRKTQKNWVTQPIPTPEKPRKTGQPNPYPHPKNPEKLGNPTKPTPEKPSKKILESSFS